MDSDRLERLVTQVLEETRAFRQETNEKLAAVDQRFAAVDRRFAAVDEQLAAVRRDIGLVQTAVLDTAQGLKRVEAKLDAHGARLDKLEGAAAAPPNPRNGT